MTIKHHLTFIAFLVVLSRFLYFSLFCFFPCLHFYDTVVRVYKYIQYIIWHVAYPYTVYTE